MTFKKLIMDSITGIDGVTVDGLKLYGFAAFIIAFLVYVGNAIKIMVTTNLFDPVAFCTGFTVLIAGLGVIAAGVAIKSHTEPPQQ